MEVSEEKFLALKRNLLRDGSIEARIISNSMAPLIVPNDIITIQPLNLDELGDYSIIVFKSGKALFCHIFVGFSQIERKHLKTIGLNNDGIDYPISIEDCLGVVTNYKLSFFHKIKLFLKLGRT